MEKSSIHISPAGYNLPDQKKQHPLFILIIAQFFSYIFHPLFVPLFAVYYLAFIHPSFFVGINHQQRMMIVLRVTYNMVFFPAITILLLKGVGFIHSIFLKTQRERIFGYIASQIFFFWMYLVFKNQIEVPLIITSFVFGAFLTSSFALILNIYFKISMHAMGVGGLLGLMLILLYNDPAAPITLPLMIVIFMCGVVCTSRLIVSDHKQGDIYMGLFVGLVCQFLAALFIL